ncbi:MAG: hypothetical protein LBU46_01265 [Candidatus Accumulibacter sp.]|nr:hypothetical protein [Accumulibacter sp.]
MSSANTPSPSIVQTGLKAGGTFLGTLLLGGILGILLSGGMAWFYWANYLTDLGGMPGLAHTGSVGALIVLPFVLLTQPQILIGVLLPCFVFAYGALAFFYGWRRALQKVVAAHSGTLAERLASLVADRLASTPRSQNRLGSVRQWLSEDSVTGKLESALGDSSWARRVVRFAVKRLPWSELLADWEAETDAHEGAEDQSLRALLSSRIATALNEIASPSRLPLGLCLAAHAVLLGLGIWLAT